MPLVKKDSSEQIVQSKNIQAQLLPHPSTLSQGMTNRLGGTREVGEKPLTKDDYWRRREERDIETGIRIRRSGVWQAALKSVGVLQFNTSGTLEGMLALVEKVAEVGLSFVNKD
jgi:hypothetical protein